ncbi:hypothetical protein P152DRAFT_288011 [Eremomyces bilateralis CBS 781.70]|uniref:Uncharacterized protein n=1 Tax=Eremomyces bilateralis CBS 781.70 TaxID=1392243 RepID=A0A6G1G6V6_9PEZI|nr:uncharacterized protein P152DRAFT_288011 [Eremomyces bilateralis CBS 781.70]KAF1813666.1 hypothetical protein P152DRAFT_288011 [Eremomyces bilateralis CBS 781.70]
MRDSGSLHHLSNGKRIRFDPLAPHWLFHLSTQTSPRFLSNPFAFPPNPHPPIAIRKLPNPLSALPNRRPQFPLQSLISVPNSTLSPDRRPGSLARGFPLPNCQSSPRLLWPVKIKSQTPPQAPRHNPSPQQDHVQRLIISRLHRASKPWSLSSYPTLTSQNRSPLWLIPRIASHRTGAEGIIPAYRRILLHKATFATPVKHALDSGFRRSLPSPNFCLGCICSCFITPCFRHQQQQHCHLSTIGTAKIGSIQPNQLFSSSFLRHQQ